MTILVRLPIDHNADKRCAQPWHLGFMPSGAVRMKRSLIAGVLARISTVWQLSLAKANIVACLGPILPKDHMGGRSPCRPIQWRPGALIFWFSQVTQICGTKGFFQPLWPIQLSTKGARGPKNNLVLSCN
ncbi:MAG: hypothetical protein WBH04_11630 [Albidovulum sp.]